MITDKCLHCIGASFTCIFQEMLSRSLYISIICHYDSNNILGPSYFSLKYIWFKNYPDLLGFHRGWSRTTIQRCLSPWHQIVLVCLDPIWFPGYFKSSLEDSWCQTHFKCNVNCCCTMLLREQCQFLKSMKGPGWWLSRWGLKLDHLSWSHKVEDEGQHQVFLWPSTRTSCLSMAKQLQS